MSAANEIKASVPLGATASQLYAIHCNNEVSRGRENYC